MLRPNTRGRDTDVRAASHAVGELPGMGAARTTLNRISNTGVQAPGPRTLGARGGGGLSTDVSLPRFVLGGGWRVGLI